MTACAASIALSPFMIGIIIASFVFTSLFWLMPKSAPAEGHDGH